MQIIEIAPITFCEFNSIKFDLFDHWHVCVTFVPPTMLRQQIDG